MTSTPSVNIARLTYLLICEAGGIAVAMSLNAPLGYGLVGGLLIAGFFIWVETLVKGFTLRGFSTATFGLGVGLLCAWLLTRIDFTTLIQTMIPDDPELPQQRDAYMGALKLAIDTVLYSSFGFLGAVLALRSNHDDFSFVIPYVRFRQEATTGQPVVLDQEVVIDGRLPGIIRSGFLSGRLVVPRFVLEELQQMSTSSQNGARLRGQRGLDALEAMQKAPDIQITLHESSARKDEKLSKLLIETTRLLGARLMTGDENLGKVARLQGIQVLNIDELDQALKPPAGVGDKVRITLVRSGKEDHQAVGYLPDGTMIVVNHAVAKIGSVVDVTVVSTLQTSAGMMVFAELAQA
ncbi:hypothetical protein OVA24_20525 [Luteolibacter sp. SL250]|uniref:PIN/TRAM domain-containing protein n=1 Tax=Luteolibacter sp. SL250 TaxID=2995170 RepID=UPI00226E1197|nr:hypothetical protein [Luteolibacter sp. SL250]WAC19608.1 hypothetical protein OVA24_20525 [Luteolibacter sp. SL250]